jgi:hypothetical protein
MIKKHPYWSTRLATPKRTARTSRIGEGKKSTGGKQLLPAKRKYRATLADCVNFPCAMFTALYCSARKKLR